MGCQSCERFALLGGIIRFAIGTAIIGSGGPLVDDGVEEFARSSRVRGIVAIGADLDGREILLQTQVFGRVIGGVTLRIVDITKAPWEAEMAALAYPIEFVWQIGIRPIVAHK